MTTVAYQGEPGAFSEKASKKLFSEDVRLQPMATFNEVFESVSCGSVRYGVIPMENSVFGSIHQNYDLLLKHRLYIVGEIGLRIELHLMSSNGVRLRDIRTVYSQQQALGQCERFLRSLKHVKVVAFHDTAGAARMVREERRADIGAVASDMAAKCYGLKILKRNVEDNRQNYTRFVAVSRKQLRPGQGTKLSLVFAARNVPGSLFRSLEGFAQNRINLVKIESRPLVGKPWQYLFYVDVEGSLEEVRLREALNHLKQVSTFCRILGTYEKARSLYVR